MQQQIIPVILSGGFGSRLWPLSRKLLPKQFLQLSQNGNSLFQETLLRLREIEAHDPIIVSNAEHRFLVAEHLRNIGIDKAKIVLEPEGKNTAPAVALAAHLAENKDAILVVLPADHEIKDPAAFQKALQQAIESAQQGYLTTFGVVPDKAETGYGYIKSGNHLEESESVFHVAEFVEKPNKEKAQSLLDSGNYFWNSGMFVFKASTFLQELEAYAPEIYQVTQKAAFAKDEDLDFIRVDSEVFSQCPSDSIDYAVMEHTKKAAVIPVDCNWTDLGSWYSIWETKEKDDQGNVFSGDVISTDTKGTLVYGSDRLVVVAGMEDCVVVDTKDAVLVANRHESQKVKDIVSMLSTRNRDEVDVHQRVYRPWGYYENLVECSAYKVKRIMVYPGAKLSLQLHHRRAEHWVVVKGEAEVVNGDQTLRLNENESTYIPIEAKHRLSNPTEEELIIIEVQCGDYLGEDDIVRLEDTYGRVS